MRTEAEFLALVESKLPSRRPLAPRAVLLAATAAILLCGAMIGTVILYRAHRNEIMVDTATRRAQETVSPEIATEAPKLPVPPEQFYNGSTYTCTAVRLPIIEADVGISLGGDLWTLKGVSDAYFLLCKAENAYWGYVNYAYTPTSLAAFIADLNLNETMTIGPLYAKTYNGRYRADRIDGLDADRIRAMLFARSDSVPQRLTVKLDPQKIVEDAQANGEIVTPPYDPTGQYIVDRTIAADISISISLPKLGFENISISLSDEDDGWLWTNLLAHGNYFATSPDLVEDILAYAREAGTWTDISPADEAEPAEPEQAEPKEAVITSTVTSSPARPPSAP